MTLSLSGNTGGTYDKLSIQEELQDLKKRIAVLECQLRKNESAKKGFEVSTGKLLQFVEVMSLL